VQSFFCIVFDMASNNNDRNVRRILVFGSSGVGKTSMLNQLTIPNEARPTSDGAVVTTFNTEPLPLFQHQGVTYQFFDTAGLNEAEGGGSTVQPQEAVSNLVSLLKNSREGFNLLIFVTRGKILGSTKDNYDLFVRALTNYLIPVICVVTGCEGTDPMTDWVAQNQQHFTHKGLVFHEMVATCFQVHQMKQLEGIFKTMREESAGRVWNAIEQHSKKRIDFVSSLGGVLKVLKKVINAIGDFFGWTWRWVNQAVYDILRRCNVDEETSRKLAAEFD